MKLHLYILESNTREKIIGVILIIMGVALFVNPTPLNIKLSFTSIFIGIFIIIITEGSISKKTSDAQIEGNMDTVNKIIKDLNLNGNAIFLPRSDKHTEERILIPPNQKGIVKIPSMTNNNIILKGKNGENLGISLPPAGLKLLNEIEKNEDFKNIETENIEEKLQKFVGMNLLKSVSLKKLKSGWKLELEKPVFCNNGQTIHKQYPCPTCSAAILAITRTFNDKIRIYTTISNGKNMTYYLNLLRRKNTQGN